MRVRKKWFENKSSRIWFGNFKTIFYLENILGCALLGFYIKLAKHFFKYVCFLFCISSKREFIEKTKEFLISL